MVIDNQSMAPLATGPTTYVPDPNAAPGTMDAIGRKNAVGPSSVASPGNLKGWCETLARFGTFPLADVMEPAIRHASRGFRVTPYLRECVTDSAADMARDAAIAKLYLPDGAPIAAGMRLVTATMPRRFAASRAKDRTCCTPARSVRCTPITWRSPAATSRAMT
jgi:gamma-glutamyltranspeptidase/glutathione hydrolase